MKCFFTCMLLCCCLGHAQARQADEQDSTQAADAIEDIIKALQADAQGTEPLLLVPEQPGEGAMNAATEKKYLTALHSYYDYRLSGYEHRKQVFAWQFFSSKVIFVAVLFLVFTGIAFSGIQFYKSLLQKPSEGRAASGDILTEFEASVRGVRVSSPVLGVIVLVISLAFFYLYLVHVYPVREIF